MSDRLTDLDADAVARTFAVLAKLDEAAGEGYYVNAHTEQGVRLWSVDGYSPGYFVLEDDFWMFVANYREAS